MKFQLRCIHTDPDKTKFTMTVKTEDVIELITKLADTVDFKWHGHIPEPVEREAVQAMKEMKVDA